MALLFPTPTASDGTGGAGTSPNRKGGMNLRTAVTTLPTVSEAELVQDWAEYEPAIRRQEALSGRPAPLPTEVGPRGGRRLTARFAEWLMWLPDGWVTDVPGLAAKGRDPRAKQLHAIGNGVVPEQVYQAFAYLLNIDNAHEEESTPWPETA
ncbi:DNA (cytosine-5-)-methyltransferase [Streptomyces albidoflavus]